MKTLKQVLQNLETGLLIVTLKPPGPGGLGFHQLKQRLFSKIIIIFDCASVKMDQSVWDCVSECVFSLQNNSPFPTTLRRRSRKLPSLYNTTRRVFLPALPPNWFHLASSTLHWHGTQTASLPRSENQPHSFVQRRFTGCPNPETEPSFSRILWESPACSLTGRWPEA